MHKTEVDGLLGNGKGIIISVKEESQYDALRKKAIEEQHQKERINTLEKDMLDIKNMLGNILAALKPNE